MLVKYSLAGVAAIALILGAFAVGRAVAPKSEVTGTTKTPAKAPAAADTHEHDGHDCGLHPQETPREITPEERTKAREQLQSKVDDLNKLQEWLTIQLGEGTITGADILERMRGEKDMTVLDTLMGVLKAYPPEANKPEIVEAFLRMSREGDQDRRQVALAFLGGVWDQTGEVRRSLMDIARAEPNEHVRHSALNAFVEYSNRNPQAAEAINTDLLGLAAADPKARPVSLSVLNMLEASEATVKGLASFATDSDIAVRVSVYDRLGDVKPEHRPIALQSLENAFTGERDEVGMGVIVNAMVRAGRAEALPALRRMSQRETGARRDILAFITVLEAGEVDWERILQRKAVLEK